MADGPHVAGEGRDVSGPAPRAEGATTFATDRKAVMVVYGHDTQAKKALFAWLRAIGLNPREWSHLIDTTGIASPYIGEILDSALRDVQAVVALFTPDEYVMPAQSSPDRAGGRFQARPNVLVEAGMALISHPTRTVFVLLGDQELPSDFHGRHYVRLRNADAAPLVELANSLRRAGCDTNLNGLDWLDPKGFPDRDSQPPPRSDDRRVVSRYPKINIPLDKELDEARQRDLARQHAQNAEAAKVRVDIRAAGTDRRPYTHEIIVTGPQYYILVEIEMKVGSFRRNRLVVFDRDIQSTALRVHNEQIIRSFWAILDRPYDIPIIRFVDEHGNAYYQCSGHTQRSRSSADWEEAARGFTAGEDLGD